jgi:uncharacterized protein (TIGR03437 family)
MNGGTTQRSRAQALICAAALVPCLQAQPVIGWLTNAASYYSEEGPEEAGTPLAAQTVVGEIARGAMFVIAGGNLGPAEAQTVQDSRLLTELAGTSVNVTVGGATRSAFVVYTSARFVAGILPVDVPVGGGTVSVTYNGQTTRAAVLRVVPRSFGIFTRGGKGSGPALVHNVDSEGRYRANTFTDAARGAQVMVLWGTGLGPDRGELEVLLGDKTTKPLYAGPSGCCAGMDQIIFEIPAGVEGCFVPIVVKFSDGDLSRNFATVSIAGNGGVCSDPHNLPASHLERLQNGEILRHGSIRLREWRGAVHVTAGFSRFHEFYEPLAWAGGTMLPPFGSCVVTRTGLVVPFPLLAAPLWSDPGWTLDAGRALSVRSPHATYPVPQLPGMFYSQPWPPGAPWEAGEYIVDNGAGGSDVGPFQTTIRLPPEPLRWTNIPSEIEIIETTKDMTIEWSGGDPGREYVIISGGAESSFGGNRFICTERSDKGSFTVPSRILQSMIRGILPREVWFPGPAVYATVSVAAHSLPVRFQAGELDIGEVWYDAESFETLRFK